MIESFEIITLFPELFEPLLKTRVFERGMEKTKINLRNLRNYTSDKRKTVDDTPYGGGCGMILKPEPLSLVLDEIKERPKKNRKIYYLSPQGRLFDQAFAGEIFDLREAVLICGRYEGIDQRVIDLYVDEEISVGDFILSGGELPAMMVMESVFRMIPGVLGNEDSYKSDSFSDGLLKYSQYTRPEIFKGLRVPEILLSGNHKQISDWRRSESLNKTKRVRPDLIDNLSRKEKNKKVAKK